MWDSERTVRTGFRPAEHGFRFANRFLWPRAGQGRGWTLARAVLRLLGMNTTALGLCGGMCLAALDLYHLGRPVPKRDAPPSAGDALFRYLLRRQIDSYSGPRVPLRVLAWMWRRDGHLDRLTIAQFLHLRARLDAGAPTPLVLVRTRGISDPTANHQVLALGYTWAPLERRATIFMYDPNHPLIEPTLSFIVAPGGRLIDLRQSTGEAVRGFFLGRYRPRTSGPPA